MMASSRDATIIIHDITPADRMDIVTTLSQKLKVGGKFFVRERIGKAHGMYIDELCIILLKVGLKEVEHKGTKSEYIGKYNKIC